MTNAHLEALDIAQADPSADLITLFAQACRNHAGRVAFVCEDEELTFAGLDQASADFAAWLLGHAGLESCDRVAVQLPNSLAYPIVAWGTLRAGMILVNTNPFYTNAESRHQFVDAGVRLLVSETDRIEQSAPMLDDTPVCRVVAVGARPAVADALAPKTLADACDLGHRLPRPDLVLKRDDVAALQYTGGTTGPSKGAILTQANLIASFIQSSTVVERGDDEASCVIAPMPVYHVYGFTMHIVSNCLRGGCP